MRGLENEVDLIFFFPVCLLSIVLEHSTHRVWERLEQGVINSRS